MDDTNSILIVLAILGTLGVIIAGLFVIVEILDRRKAIQQAKDDLPRHPPEVQRAIQRWIDKVENRR